MLIVARCVSAIFAAAIAMLNLAEKTWSIPPARAKNRSPHLVPLSPMAVELFQEAIELAGKSEFAFLAGHAPIPARPVAKALASHALSHAMRDLLECFGLNKDPATPHDLRRTAATRMAELGIPDRIVGRVLNHGTELRRTITAKVYIKHDYAERSAKPWRLGRQNWNKLFQDRHTSPMLSASGHGLHEREV